MRGLGIPVALVAQNGADAHEPTWDNAEQWDVLFVGGAPECQRCCWVRTDPAERRSNCLSCASALSEWKLSPAAKLCVDEARLMGKWVHVGRVNSWRRLDLVASWDVDSVDGTYLASPPTPTAPAWRCGCAASAPSPRCREPARALASAREVPPASRWYQRWSAGRHHWRCADDASSFRPDRYRVEPLAESAARAYIVANHYSGSYPAALQR